MKIEILGSGCMRCRKLEENARKALAEANVEADVAKITKIEEIMSYGVMSTPALIIDGKVKCYGRIADVPEIKAWLK